MSGSRRDVHREITEKIIRAIEAGAGDFHMPWHAAGLPLGRPSNAITGKRYRGVNILALWVTGQTYGYTSDQWATLKQWNKLGAQVRKGEHAALIVFYKRMERERENPDTGEKATKDYLLARASFVFNADQVDGWKATDSKGMGMVASCQEAQDFVVLTGAVIRHGGDRAYYRQTTDHIQIPEEEQFTGTATSTATEAYYATLLHELTHWTAHPSRLARDLSGRFGDESYAMEELVAELGAAFLCADLGIANSPRLDHAAYIANWLKVLRDDTKALFTAASRANQAADFLAGLQPQLIEAVQSSVP